jgi:hypothetical protein
VKAIFRPEKLAQGAGHLAFTREIALDMQFYLFLPKQQQLLPPSLAFTSIIKLVSRYNIYFVQQV